MYNCRNAADNFQVEVVKRKEGHYCGLFVFRALPCPPDRCRWKQRISKEPTGGLLRIVKCLPNVCPMSAPEKSNKHNVERCKPYHCPEKTFRRHLSRAPAVHRAETTAEEAYPRQVKEAKHFHKLSQRGKNHPDLRKSGAASRAGSSRYPRTKKGGLIRSPLSRKQSVWRWCSAKTS